MTMKVLPSGVVGDWRVVSRRRSIDAFVPGLVC